jgi:N,N'-diacetyllegionaminate synthase
MKAWCGMEIVIGDRIIGHGHPAYMIAEGCDNHLGDVGAAKEMALRAKLAGADAIKFQHHLPDEEMLPDVPMSSNFDIPLYEFLQRYALSLDEHEELQAYCRSIGIQYLCTPFSWKAAQELDGLGVDAFKIGSGEMTDVPTLVRIAALGKPMLVSTGMSTFPEIDRTYEALVALDTPLALFNCVSEYPPKYEDLNLRVIESMRARYPRAVIGHSDHTPDLFTSFAAVTLGACAIEKHVILDKRQPGPDQSVSIDFPDLAQLVEGIRKIEAGLGDHKRVHDDESAIRSWAFRSLVTTRTVAAGEVLTADAVWSKRPGTGIPSHRMDEVVGRRTRRDLAANVLIAWDDLA